MTQVNDAMAIAWNKREDYRIYLITAIVALEAKKANAGTVGTAAIAAVTYFTLETGRRTISSGGLLTQENNLITAPSGLGDMLV